MAIALPAFDGSIGILCSGLRTYVSWPNVRLLSETERIDLGFWHGYLSRIDDGGLHGLRAALGPAVLLGSECYCLFSRCHSRYR